MLVYWNLFYDDQYPLNVCATGNYGYFKGIDYWYINTKHGRVYFGNGNADCNTSQGNVFEFFLSEVLKKKWRH